MPKANSHPPILLGTDLNLPKLDGKPCARCGEVPLSIRDRIDCDAGNQWQSVLVTYHMECWKLACDDFTSKQLTRVHRRSKKR